MPATRLKDHTLWDLSALGALASFFLIFRLGDGSLASWDEAIYASVAKDILRTGDWLRLSIAGQPWFDKPPLAIWFTALFYKVFGVSELAARLFSALCGVGCVIATYLIGRKLLNRWVGFLGALVLLSSSHFIRFARFGMLDAPLTLFLTLALYFFWLGRGRNRYLIFSGIMIGLAVMVKGFAAFLIFPVIWVYCLCSGELDVLGRSSYWIGVLIAVAIALPWFAYEMMTGHDKFMKDVVVKHLVMRTTTALEGHDGNFYFYIRTMVNKFHPWILIGIVSGPWFVFRAIKDRDRECIYLSSWMFVILLILTATRTKLPWYVLPIYPALSLTVGWVLAKMIHQRRRWLTLGIFAAVLVLHVTYSHLFHHDYSRDIKGIAASVKSLVPPEESVTLYIYHESPAAAFYLERTTLYADVPATVRDIARQGRIYLLVHDKDIPALRPELTSLHLTEQASFEGLRLFKK